jgi:soluble lytic murein transglycosylase-like protein
MAMCGLLGAVLLTPSGELATPSLGSLREARPVPVTDVVVGPPMPADSVALERDVVTRYEYRPLARILGRHTREPAIAVRIARAIVKEARRLQVSPSLLTGVLLTENPRLEPHTVSSQGAVGLMQVMHFHAGEFDCGSSDLVQVESNICHGARIFGRYLQRTGNVRAALLRYNGCVASVNTPNCGRYPSLVLRKASLVRRQLLLYPPYRFAVDSTIQ